MAQIVVFLYLICTITYINNTINYFTLGKFEASVATRTSLGTVVPRFSKWKL